MNKIKKIIIKPNKQAKIKKFLKLSESEHLKKRKLTSKLSDIKMKIFFPTPK